MGKAIKEEKGKARLDAITQIPLCSPFFVCVCVFYLYLTCSAYLLNIYNKSTWVLWAKSVQLFHNSLRFYSK